MLTGHYFWSLIALMGNLFDLLDGAVARANGKVTAFGSFLDSTIDRFSDFMIISAFGFAYLVRGEIVVALLAISFLVSYSRARAELASPTPLKMQIGLIERSERIIFLFLTLLLNFLNPNFLWHGMNVSEVGFLILIILSIFTLGQRISFAYNNL
jgi:phosphatidylglycerophosphate synthase